MTRFTKHIVTIGGGTGSFAMLSALKRMPGINLSAIVTMADDGGTNGMLRKELGVLPPSDARQCLVALANEDDPLAKLLDYRFNTGTLAGHSFGSIFLAVLERTTGDFKKAIRKASEILNVTGKIIPVTEDQAELVVTLRDGSTIEGESMVDKSNLNEGVENISYKNTVKLSKDAQETMLKADYIIICPGDFYTSLVPNFIVLGFKETISQSKAKIILFVNLVNKREHTAKWQTSDYVSNIEKYLGRKVDVIVAGDTNTLPNALVNDMNDKRVITAELASKKQVVQNGADPLVRSTVRHDPEKVARCLGAIIKN